MLLSEALEILGDPLWWSARPDLVAHLPTPSPDDDEEDDDDDGRGSGGGNIDPDDDEGGYQDDDEDEDDTLWTRRPRRHSGSGLRRGDDHG